MATRPNTVQNLLLFLVISSVGYNSIFTAVFDVGRWDDGFLPDLHFFNKTGDDRTTGEQNQSLWSPSATSQSSIVEERPTLHVLNALHGNDEGFIDEWEVNFKSVLSNAPLDANLHVHVMANNAASIAVQARLEKANLNGTMWRNKVDLTLYNVERHVANWTSFIRTKLQDQGTTVDSSMSFGIYYRLLAMDVLDNQNIGPVVYMDTDVVVMANLNDILPVLDPTKLYQFSATWPNSGFMVINVKHFHIYWEMLRNLNLTALINGNDQRLVARFAKEFPDEVGTLPTQWDVHLGHGWRPQPQSLLEKQKEGVGMLHFTGKKKGNSYFDKGFEQYCERTPNCHVKMDMDAVSKSWGLVDYYVRLQWTWVVYFAKSSIRLGKEGYPFQIEVKE